MRLTLPILLTLAMATMAAFAVGLTMWLTFSGVADHYQEALYANMRQDADRKADRFLSLIQELQRDVRMLESVPPIQGIIRSRAHGGVDPLDGSTEELWVSRLQVIYGGMLVSKPHYMQVRYIGLADGGLELVRVTRNIESQIVDSNEALQEKGTRDYVTNAASLPRGSIYLSKIELNREFGAISEPHTPVIRAAIPVYSQVDQKPFGVVVININANHFFDSLSSLSRPGALDGLANAEGAYLVHPHGGPTFDFDLGGRSNVLDDIPQSATVLQRGGSQTFRDERSGQLMHIQSVNYNPNTPYGKLVLIAAYPDSQIRDYLGEIGRSAGLAIALLLMFCLIVAIVLAQVITQPLIRLKSRFESGTEEQAEASSALNYREAEDLDQALRRAFHKIRQKNAELASKNRELDQFAYIASHDLQEPVRNMSTVADMLTADKNNVLSPQSERALGFLTTATDRMRNLIHGLLEYSRIGRASEVELVDLNEVLDNVRADLRLRIEETQAEIQIENRLPTFLMYEVEVRMLFQNLISNALKFIPSERQPQIRIASETLGLGHWRFSISDNGIGIPVSQYKKIFTIFHRATTRKEFEGTGIGLAHCQKIAELHHGKIWVRESSPEGTTFSVELMEVHDDDA